jgi:hypothetical protein
MEQYYRIKTVPFLSSHVNILCQKENGPCPILAIANALILLKRLAIAPGSDVVSSTSLLNALANIALEQYRPTISGGSVTSESLGISRDGNGIEAHRLQHIQDVIQLLPRLLVGMVGCSTLISHLCAIPYLNMMSVLLRFVLHRM